MTASDSTRPTLTPPRMPPGNHAAGRIEPGVARLTTLAGWSMVGIAALHVVFWSVVTWPDWGAWAAGDLWGAEPATALQYRLHHGYWALIGSFAVPLLLLGLLTVQVTRLGVPLPWYVGWILLAWVLLASALMEPNGFPLGLIPSFLLIVAGRKART